MIVLVMLFFVACHHSMEPWPSDGDRQEVAMYVRTRSLSGITPSSGSYQFFVYDKEKNKVSQYSVNPDVNNPNLLHMKLFPGSYTGYCVTNATAAECWEFADNLPPAQIYLKAQKTKSGHEEAGDHLLGTTDFSVGEENANNAIFDLSRKVGMLKVVIENIPEWLTDLKINVSNVPQKMSLTGEFTGSYTISKDITIPDENGVSETHILLFPPKEKATLSLSSEAMVFITPEHTIESILANRVTEIKVIFQEPANLANIDITTQLIEWDDPSIQEEDWKIDMPQGICTGTGNGTNLVVNGGFEGAFANGIPENWTLDAASKDYPKTAAPATDLIQEGNKAVRIEGKTYIYQDIPVTGGRCYQLNMYVNAPETDARWKYWGTWMKGSTNLSSDLLRSVSYEKTTNGYIDVFNGKVFRAPATATKLRLEVRNYNDPVTGKGVYIDQVSVQHVD